MTQVSLGQQGGWVWAAHGTEGSKECFKADYRGLAMTSG